MVAQGAEGFSNPTVASGVRSLAEAWRRGLSISPSATALRVDGVALTYSELNTVAVSLAVAFNELDPTGAPVGVLATRSLDAYVGCLAAVLAGRTYVPLHPEFPLERTAGMLRRSGAVAVVVGPEGDSAAEPLVALAARGPVLCFPTREVPGWVRAVGAEAVGASDLRTISTLSVAESSDEAVAYLLFTSGSTGQPKGVGVTQANVAAYLSHAVLSFGYSATDRCSQMFDLTFDLSVHDLFVTWMAGACLCVPSRRAVIAPGKFIRDEKLTVWFSVPSTAMVMDRLRMLKPNAFPSLRVSLFCGEALSVGIASKWSAAAPNASLHNLYGPTEATIAITAFEWAPGRAEEGIVPIGDPFPGHHIAVVDPSGNDVGIAGPGELCLAGPQVTPGYWDDPGRTAASFVTLPGSPDRWYRTGDLVERSASDGLRYHGRIDDQVQVLGFRVELVEVDAALRAVLETESAVAVAYPPGPTAEAVYAFAIAADDEGNEAAAIAKCRERLPAYMVPHRVFFVDTLPLNSNGKIDRVLLRSTLEKLLHV